MTKFGYAASLAPWIRLVLLLSTIWMLIPQTAALGSILVAGYLGGATATQVRVQDGWFPFPVMLGVTSWLACTHAMRACGRSFRSAQAIDDPIFSAKVRWLIVLTCTSC
jgi:hypothetical protein